jgi:hypothetical protein
VKYKWKPLKVLFIGDEASSLNVSKEVPFVGTPSYKRLLRWIGELDLDIKNVKIINKNDYKSSICFDKTIFLGKKVAKNIVYRSANFEILNGIKLSNTIPKSYSTVDHPSPRNRKFNNPNYEKKMLKELKKWLYKD